MPHRVSESEGRPALKLSSIDAMRYDDVRSDVLRRAERLAGRMEALEDEGVIDVHRTDRGDVCWRHQRSAVYHPPQDRPDEDEHSPLHDECRYWERDSEFELAPEFERTSVTDGAERVEFPEVVLLVYDGDIVRWNLEGVFPSVYERTGMPVTPEDYLATLESGGDWRPSETDLVRESHESKRDELVQRLARNPTLAGDGWQYYDTDAVVPSVDGRIDVLLEHESRTAFMVVVIAPDPTDQSALDRAFGRVIRLRTGFARDVDVHENGLDGVRMAVAAPTFPEGYDWFEETDAVEFVTLDLD